MPEPAPVRQRREALLRDDRVERWYKGRRSQSTAEAQLSQLELFLRRTKLTVDRLTELGRDQRAGKSRNFEDAILAWIEQGRKAGRPDAYLATNWAAVRSFLKHEEAEPSWTPKFKIRTGETILNEVVPTPEQLFRVLDRCPTARVRSVILLLATSGMRIGTLGSRYSPTGLRLKHLPDLKLKPEPHFAKTPFRIDIPAELSKSGQAYFTFGTEETAGELCRYLSERVARDERLGPDSAVIAPEPKASNVHLRVAPDGVAFLSEKGTADEIRRAFAKVTPTGVRWRPYVLRSFASSQLVLGENAGLITRDSREFLLGHNQADIGRRYNLGKGRLRDDLQQQLRQSYSATADRFLRILAPPTREADFRPMLRFILMDAGYSKEEIDAEGELTYERSIEMIRAKRATPADVTPPKSGDNFRTVPNAELDAWLEKGWKPVAAAGSDRFVVGPA